MNKSFNPSEDIFFIYPNNNGYCNAIVEDLRSLPNAIFFKKPHNLFFQKIQHIHTSLKLNIKFRVPFQSFWYKSYLPPIENHRGRKVFVFFQSTPLGYDEKYLAYLKNKYKNCVLVFYWLNIVITVNPRYISIVNRNYDLIYTFDKGDADYYKWHHYDTMFSRVKDLSLCDYLECSDVFFVGNAKGRLNSIHDAYKSLTEQGYKCDFYISGVPELQKKYEGIHYNLPLSYKEVLAHAKHSRCILEVMQQDQVGCTLRTLEAICLEKKLLTNNFSLKQSKFNGSYILFCSEFHNIILNQFLEKEMPKSEYAYLQDSVSPIRFIEELKKSICKIKFNLS